MTDATLSISQPSFEDEGSAHQLIAFLAHTAVLAVIEPELIEPLHPTERVRDAGLHALCVLWFQTQLARVPGLLAL